MGGGKLFSLDVLQLLVEISPDAVVIVDAAGVIKLANAQADSLFGYEAGGLIGRQVEVLIPARVATDHPWLRERYVADPRPRPMGAGLDLMARRQDGEEFPVDIALSPLQTEDGMLVSAAVRDMSERRRAEQERELLRTEQFLRMESIGQLAGGIAHDFNNLLAVVLSYSEFVGETVEQHITGCATSEGLATVADDLQAIRDAAQRAASLTRQLLIFARREASAPELMSVNEAIESVSNLVRRSLGEHLTVKLMLEPNLAPINADPALIEQVIVSLVLNARDAMPAGGSVIIETENFVVERYPETPDDLQPGPYIRLTVADTGVGMSPDVAARAFEPFFTTKPRGSGTGLGLATVYGIATRDGGSVRIYSTVGKGTSVRVYFPAAVDETFQGAGRRRGRGTGRILICEDEDPVRELTRRVLQKAGYEVTAASTPDEALSMQIHRVDLLVTDVIMPGSSGPELADSLRARWPSLKVLYMSGYPEDILADQGIVDPGVELIRKPFTHEQLLERVHARFTDARS